MNIEFLRAARRGDLPRVQKMLADGDARITDAGHLCCTALLHASMGSNALPTLIWLLKVGGACITDRNHDGNSALLLAATNSNLATCQWLLEHGGAAIADVNDSGETVWNLLLCNLIGDDAEEVTALLRVMVLKNAPPDALVANLRPEHVLVVEEGARLRAALPAYLARRRAILDTHCPLIAPLRALVREYNPEPTTTEELWATVPGAAPQHARRPRVETAVALPMRRSARVRQRLGW
jgi:hypothetical protein